MEGEGCSRHPPALLGVTAWSRPVSQPRAGESRAVLLTTFSAGIGDSRGLEDAERAGAAGSTRRTPASDAEPSSLASSMGSIGVVVGSFPCATVSGCPWVKLGQSGVGTSRDYRLPADEN